MLTDDVKNYLQEIARMLRPGGHVMLTCFLMDHGQESDGLCFPHRDQEHFYTNQAYPEIAVGYLLDFFTTQAADHQLTLKGEPLWGRWRRNASIPSDTGFSQDILILTPAGS